jgi:voltage-gated potassium channel
MEEIKNDKKEVSMDALHRCQNPFVIAQIESLLEREQVLAPIGKISKDYPLLLRVKSSRDTSLQTNLKIPTVNRLTSYQNKVVWPKFIVSLIMLIISAAIINNFSYEDGALQYSIFISKMLMIYGYLWTFFVLDAFIVMVLAYMGNVRIAQSALIRKLFGLIFPPIAIGQRNLIDPDKIWLPFYNWSKCNEGLFNHLKKQFSIPMIIIALLIIPVLLIEWQFYEEVENFLNTDLSLLLGLIQGFIWFAFAFEFLLLIAITDNKFSYIKRNWIDLLIILLPFVSFVRSIRLVKVAKITQLSRGYKLRALLMKAREGFIFASFFSRIMAVKPDFQLNKLMKKFNENQKEREIIEEDLAKLCKTLIDKKQINP